MQRMHALRQSGVAFRGGLGQFEHSKERPPRGSISPVRGCCWAVHRGILRELAYLSAGAGIAPWWWDMLAYILGSNGQRLGLSLKRTAATAGAGPAARSTRGRPCRCSLRRECGSTLLGTRTCAPHRRTVASGRCIYRLRHVRFHALACLQLRARDCADLRAEGDGCWGMACHDRSRCPELARAVCRAAWRARTVRRARWQVLVWVCNELQHG